MTSPKPTDLRTILRDILDNGLIYWEPQTARGAVAKARMIANAEKAFAEVSPKPTDAVALLKELEFISDERGHYACPICGRETHAPDCRLAKAIADQPADPPGGEPLPIPPHWLDDDSNLPVPDFDAHSAPSPPKDTP
jgi:hypothetical protein